MRTWDLRIRWRAPRRPLSAAHGPSRKAVVLALLLGIGLAPPAGQGSDTTLTEYRVKALFLMNFARYVEWPVDSFESANSPIVIGVIGENRFGGDLAAAVEGRSVEGRAVLQKAIATPDDADKCQILFVSASAKTGVSGILRRIRTKSVLSVGESEHFTDFGGIINFVKKDGKVRLEVNLDAAREARLQISAKLLSVADVVTGKAN